MTSITNPSFTGKRVNKILKTTAQTLYNNDAAILAGKLDQFAATSSAELASIISDETGTGTLVFSNAPTLVNPIVGTQTQGDSSTKAASTAYVDIAVASVPVGLQHSRGAYDASVGTYPATGGSGSAGAIMNGDYWYISVVGSIGSLVLGVGEQLIAVTDTPGQTSSNWIANQSAIPYTPEDVANKSTDVALGTSDTLYPAQKAVKSYVDTMASAITKSVSIKSRVSTTTGRTLTLAECENKGVSVSVSLSGQTFSLPAVTATEDGIVFIVENGGATNAFTLSSVNGFNIDGTSSVTMASGDKVVLEYIHASTQFIMCI